jgi:hypothetical protein
MNLIKYALLLFCYSITSLARTEQEMSNDMKTSLAKYVELTQTIIKRNTAKDISPQELNDLLKQRSDLEVHLDAVEAEHKKAVDSK